MSDIWFISDTHFGHNSILKHCKRPFSNVQNHDTALLYEIVKTVKPRDKVYCLGDFIWKRREIAAYFKVIRGKWTVVPGNHDENFRNELKKFCKVEERLIHVKFNRTLFVLCHYPLDTWNGSHHTSVHLHGHSHGTLGTYRKNRFDVGWDVHHKLVNLDEILSWIK
jgi:calcineurin-like phosphoesterase family protein